MGEGGWKQSITLGVEWEGMFSLMDGWRGSIGDMGGRMFGNDVKHGMDRMVGWYGWWDCIGDRIALMVGWVERMHGRDTALNGDSCNATTMHPLHHQQFNQIFPLSHLQFVFCTKFLCKDFLPGLLSNILLVSPTIWVADKWKINHCGSRLLRLKSHDVSVPDHQRPSTTDSSVPAIHSNLSHRIHSRQW